MDPFKATWVSHSSIGNYLKCPRLYFLHDFYKDPKTGKKLSIISPPLALGQAVHEVLDRLVDIKPEDRFETALTEIFLKTWKNYKGEAGGFTSETQEKEYKERGVKMLKNVSENPGPLLNKSLGKVIKDKFPDFVPHFWLSQDDEIILNGKIDWLEYLPESDSVHIIDFKTGKNYEDENSLQLPIYLLLASNLQKRKVTKASYWYLEGGGEVVEVKLPDPKQAYDSVYKISSRIKLARKLNAFKCPTGGCKHCIPYEMISRGKGKLVGSNGYQDIYIMNQHRS